MVSRQIWYSSRGYSKEREMFHFFISLHCRTSFCVNTELLLFRNWSYYLTSTWHNLENRHSDLGLFSVRSGCGISVLNETKAYIYYLYFCSYTQYTWTWRYYVNASSMCPASVFLLLLEYAWVVPLLFSDEQRKCTEHLLPPEIHFSELQATSEQNHSFD